jgi:peptidoglycan/LPS O-acetylase OafA/YrhL
MPKLPSLNGLRAISIIIVILHHLQFKYTLIQNQFILQCFGVFFDGMFGVTVFFVISGFLITNLLLQEEAGSGVVSLKNFFIRRTLRIFPAYYFLLFIYFLLQVSGYISIPNISWLTAITYTKYLNGGRDWYTAHGWSLSVEEHFYLFWPLIFKFKPKLRNKIPFLLILFVFAYKFLFAILFPDKVRNDHLIFTTIDAISIGCLFAIHKEKILHWMSQHWNSIILISVSIIYCLSYFEYFTSSNTFLKYLFLMLGTAHGTISDLCIALIMFYSIFGPQNLWFHLLNTKTLNFIGLLSYSIYLWQQLFINQSDLFIHKLPLNLLFIPIAAMFSYYIIEMPFLKLKSRF